MTVPLSIVATLYQSGPYIRDFYARTVRAAEYLRGEFELILVNDGSTDASFQIAVDLAKADPRITLIDLSRNFGHHKAIMTGLMQATGERVFLVDSDLEEDPAWLVAFDETYRKERCDVVYGIQDRRKGRFFERLSGALFYGAFNLLSDMKIPANAVTARLMSRRYVQSLVQSKEREVFLFGLFPWIGYRQVAVVVPKGSKGRSTYTLARKMTLLVDALTSFSDRPLYYIFYAGAAISALAALYILRLLFRAFAYGIPVPGWASLIVSVWFLGGLAFLFLGVVGLYLSKVFTESKQRPYTIIRETYSSQVSNQK